MDDLIDFIVCGEVNPYDFVRGCTEENFAATRSKYFPRLQRDYAHLMDCQCCEEGLHEALSEFATGNSLFRRDLFMFNVTYLEQSLKRSKA